MDRILDAYLHGHLAGQLVQNEAGLLEFTYAPSYLQVSGALALSQSLPLRRQTFGNSECKGYFAGILPEGEVRKIIARNLGVSAGNDFSMLDRIGVECAGAVTFLSSDMALQNKVHRYKRVTGRNIETILEELPRRPLLAGEEGIRLSLAGARDKLAVYISGGKIYLPLGNAPSSHILKPEIAGYEHIVENEAICMTLAARLGLTTAGVRTGQASRKKYLLIERYDRKPAGIADPPVQRLHQEDFCQALGIIPDKKYEEEGGVSVKQCFDLLRRVSTVPVTDLRCMLDAVIYNFIIGNHDAHGKNFSLLYDRSSQGITTRLAPLYDLICTAVHPQLHRKLAMKIDDKYRSESIRLSHFEMMAGEAGLSVPFVRQRVKALTEHVIDLLDAADDPIFQSGPEVTGWIRTHALKVRGWF